MYRSTLPRIYEVRDALPEPEAPNSYLRNLEERLSSEPRRQHFTEIEHALACLDHAAWTYLKSEIINLGLVHKGARRGWSQLQEKFSEAKAYAYLRQRGFSAVSFIPRADGKTPDLQAEDGRVLCEVKTINPSNEEVERREYGRVIDITNRLDAGFFRKLESVLATARNQITAFHPDPAVNADRLCGHQLR